MKKDLMIVACTLVIGAAALAVLVYLSLPHTNTVPIAIYPQMVATVYDGKLEKLVIDAAEQEPGGRTDIYVRLTPDRTVRVLDLTQQDAGLLPLQKKTIRTPDGESREHYSNSWTAVIFINGKCAGAIFDAGIPIQLAPGPNGPYFTLPITKKQMYELFGKPLYWERTKARGGI